jgi:urease gamma subunit
MSDFARYTTVVTVMGEVPAPNEVKSRVVRYNDIPERITLQQAAEGIQELLDIIDLEAWFNDGILKKQV